MKFLIIGATGLIGSNLLQEILLSGSSHEIYLVGRHKAKLKKVMSSVIIDSSNEHKINFLVTDITKEFRIDFEIDVVYFAAGNTGYEFEKNNPELLMSQNLNGILNLVNAMGNRKYRLIFLSSLSVYETSSIDTVVYEDDKLIDIRESNISFYSFVKILSEKLLLQLNSMKNFDLIIARLSTVIGFTIFEPKTSYYKMLDEILANKVIKIDNDVFQRKDILDIKDCVSALFLLSQIEDNDQIYNISSQGKEGSYLSFVELLIKTMDFLNEIGYELNVLNYSILQSKFSVNGISLSNIKIKTHGWLPKSNISQTIEKLINEKIKTLVQYGGY